jgi:hypothetical protein
VSIAFAEDVVWELVPEVEVEEGMVISLVQVLTDAIDLKIFFKKSTIALFCATFGVILKRQAERGQDVI